jgi:hypothetical protein
MESTVFSNDLEKYFYNNNGRLINKWKHYFEIYDRHFSKYRGKEVIFLEIGVFQGGSLEMWQNYFGPKAKIYGVDIDPRCKAFERENIEIFIGSQSDVNFLNELKVKIPKVDILLDDGGHTMNQMRVSFDNLYDHIKSDGLYMCEDLHACYWLNYGGGYKRSNSFIEYSKNFVDYLHAWHSTQKSLTINKYTKTMHSIHFYDSIIAIEKRLMETPVSLMTGTASFDFSDQPSKMTTGKKIKKLANLILQYLRMPSIGID